MTAPRRHDLRLFDDFERTDMEYAKRTEEGFDWWNRSALPEFAAMRDELEYWFGRYCPNDAPRLRREFRANRRPQHLGALFELFLHEHLLKSGFTVECQLDLTTSASRPDFLVLAAGEPAFVLEAKVKLESDGAATAERRRQEVFEALRHLRAPDFFVSVTTYGTPTKSVRKGPLLDGVTRWLASLDHDQLLALQRRNPYADHATWTWSGEGLTLEFTAFARGESRGQDMGTLLMAEIDGEARLEPTDRQLAGALDKKLRKYKGLGLPFVVGVALMDFTADSDDVQAGLESAWGTPNAPKSGEVSGVLLAFLPNIAAATSMIPHLVLNPAALRPLGPHAAAFTPFSGHLRTPVATATP